jgi:hypothetical protein
VQGRKSSYRLGSTERGVHLETYRNSEDGDEGEGEDEDEGEDDGWRSEDGEGESEAGRATERTRR